MVCCTYFNIQEQLGAFNLSLDIWVTFKKIGRIF